MINKIEEITLNTKLEILNSGMKIAELSKSISERYLNKKKLTTNDIADICSTLNTISEDILNITTKSLTK